MNTDSAAGFEKSKLYFALAASANGLWKWSEGNIVTLTT